MAMKGRGMESRKKACAMAIAMAALGAYWIWNLIEAMGDD